MNVSFLVVRPYGHVIYFVQSEYVWQIQITLLWTWKTLLHIPCFIHYRLDACEIKVFFFRSRRYGTLVGETVVS